MKFIRFAQWRIEQTGVGILAFITNHGYLDNPTFRGMRQSLMVAFDRIYALDLHGSLIKKETSPDGTVDQNVFDIQPGVALLLAVKDTGCTSEHAQVFQFHLWGSREKKYDWLISSNVQPINWDSLTPQRPFYLFTPQNIDLLNEYESGWKISEVISINNMGVTTGRDAFATDCSAEELRDRVLALRGQKTDEEIRACYDLWESSSFSLKVAQLWSKTSDVKSSVVPFNYRCFDQRFVIYSSAILARSREDICKHQIDKENLAIVTFRSIRELPWQHTFVARHPVAKEYISSMDNCFVFPLYLYSVGNSVDHKGSMPENLKFFLDHDNRKANLNPNFVSELSKQLGWHFTTDGQGDLNRTFGPEDIFHYIYAVLHSPVYRQRYVQFLKIDFPRVPLTSNRDLFRTLCFLGADLVALHFMESPGLDQYITTYTGPANPAVEKVSYDGDTVWLDKTTTRGFRGVPEDVWNFHIGGYQVCEKWLKDRGPKKGQPGRTLTPEDIEHYHRIVVALNETIRLMGEIDAVIDEHGGWPIE